MNKLLIHVIFDGHDPPARPFERMHGDARDAEHRERYERGKYDP